MAMIPHLFGGIVYSLSSSELGRLATIGPTAYLRVEEEPRGTCRRVLCERERLTVVRLKVSQLTDDNSSTSSVSVSRSRERILRIASAGMHRVS